MMHEIVTGTITAEQARDLLTETAAADAMSGPRRMRSAMFDLPEGETNEPDHTTIAGVMFRQAGGKIKDALTG